MKLRMYGICGAVMLACVVLPASGVILTDLDPNAAPYDRSFEANDKDGGGDDVTAAEAVLGNGHTFNVTFYVTLTEVALSSQRSLPLMEIGDTSSGTGLYLYQSQVMYVTKHNSSDDRTPDSLNDLALRPDGASAGEVAVQSSYGGLSAGQMYSAAASWDQAGNLQLAVSGPNGVVLDEFAITGEVGDWAGNASVSTGQHFEGAGGLSGAEAGNELGAPFDVDDSVEYNGALLSRSLYWNSSSTLVPEPGSVVLMGLGVVGLLRRRVG